MGHGHTQIVSKIGYPHGQLQIEIETYSYVFFFNLNPVSG